MQNAWRVNQITSKPAPVLLCASTLKRVHSRPSFAPIIRSVTHIKGCALPAHTNKHEMPITKHREKEARDKIEAARQKSIEDNLKRTMTCPSCLCLFIEAFKYTPYLLSCGHTLCAQCVKFNLPRGYLSRDQPLACPVCDKKFPGDSYLATRNFELIAMAEAFADAESPK